MNHITISKALSKMSDEERINTWNKIHDTDSPYHIYRMDELDRFCKEKKLEPIEILRHFHSPKQFTPYDEYWIDSSEDVQEVISFDHLSQCPIYDDNKIIDYVEDFGFEGLLGPMKLVKTDRDTAKKVFEEGGQIALGYLDDNLYYNNKDCTLTFEEAEDEAREWWWEMNIEYYVLDEEEWV